MKRPSRIVLACLVGVGVLFLILWVRVHESADIAPIVTVTTPTSIRAEPDVTLFRPERTQIEFEAVASKPQRGVTFRPDLHSILRSSSSRTARFVRAQPQTPNDYLQTYHENGLVESEGLYRDGEKEGHWNYYSELGLKELSTTYLGGKAEGTSIAWHENGQVRAVAECRAGQLDGLCSFWRPDGALDAERSGVYQQGQLLTRR